MRSESSVSNGNHSANQRTNKCSAILGPASEGKHIPIKLSRWDIPPVECHLTTHSPLNTHCTTLHHQGIYKGNYKDFLMNILTKKESLTILDAACGTGVN